MSEISSTDLRGNTIRSNRSDVKHNRVGEDNPSSKVVNAGDYSCKDDTEISEADSLNAASESTKKPSKKGVNPKGNLNQGLEDTSNFFFRTSLTIRGDLLSPLFL